MAWTLSRSRSPRMRLISLSRASLARSYVSIPSSLLASRTSFRSCCTLRRSCARISSRVSRAFLRNALRIVHPPFPAGARNLEPGPYRVNAFVGDDLAEKVVGISAGDPGKHQIAGGTGAVQAHDTVDLRGLVAAAPDIRSRAAALGFDEHLDLVSDPRAGAARGPASVRRPHSP